MLQVDLSKNQPILDALQKTLVPAEEGNAPTSTLNRHVSLSVSMDFAPPKQSVTPDILPGLASTMRELDSAVGDPTVASGT